MTVFFNESRQRWQYEFQQDRIRHSKFCFSPDGAPCANRRESLAAEAEAKKLAKIGPKLPRAADLTVAEVFNAISDKWAAAPDPEYYNRIAREIMDFFGRPTLIRDIDGAKVDDYIAAALKKPLMVWVGGSKRKRTDSRAQQFWKLHPEGKTRTNATVNRHIPLIRAMFQRAYKTRDAITRERAIEEVPTIKDLPEPKRKARPTPEPVMQRLHEILPPHAVDAMVITLCFGFRSDEGFGLQEPQVDWHAQGVRFFSEDVKDSEDEFLPGSQFAMGYLRCLAMEAEARGLRHLISYQPPSKKGAAPKAYRPIRKARTAWRTAMDKIEKEFGRRWRWHDLRAAFITHIAMECGPLAAQTMARHADFDTTRGYIDVANEVSRAAAETASERPALGVVVGGKR